MLGLLEDLGKNLGYDIKMEKPQRVDMSWLKDGNVEIAIEHENKSAVEKLLEKEVNNLLSIDAKLKVLISYFRDNNFAEQSSRLNELVLGRLSTKRKCDFQFLVVLTTWEDAMHPRDQYWVAYLYEPTFKYRILHCP